jgi:hypothetical protein
MYLPCWKTFQCSFCRRLLYALLKWSSVPSGCSPAPCCITPLCSAVGRSCVLPLSFSVLCCSSTTVYPTCLVLCWDGSCIALWALRRLGVFRAPPCHVPWLMHRRVCGYSSGGPLVLPDAPVCTWAPTTSVGGPSCRGGRCLHVLGLSPNARLDFGPHCVLEHVYKAQCACVHACVCAAPQGLAAPNSS